MQLQICQSGSVMHVVVKQVLKGKTIKVTDKRKVEYWFTKAGCAKLT